MFVSTDMLPSVKTWKKPFFNLFFDTKQEREIGLLYLKEDLHQNSVLSFT